MRVFVYYNLKSGKWSVRALEGINRGLVVAHADKVKLMSVTATVSLSGRARVLKECQKNVHAGLRGNLVAMAGVVPVRGRELPACLNDNDIPENIGDAITYNPYKRAEFYYKDTDEAYINSCFAFMLNKRVNVI